MMTTLFDNLRGLEFLSLDSSWLGVPTRAFHSCKQKFEKEAWKACPNIPNIPPLQLLLWPDIIWLVGWQVNHMVQVSTITHCVFASSVWWAGLRSCCGTAARWATSSTPSSTPCTSTAPPSSVSTLGGILVVKDLGNSNKNDVLQTVDGNCARLGNDREPGSPGGKI